MPRPYNTAVRRRSLPRRVVRELLEQPCAIQGPGCLGEASEIDHRVALAQGGEDEVSNLQPVCVVCHRRKSRAEALWGLQKRRERGRYPTPRHPGLVA